MVTGEQYAMCLALNVYVATVYLNLLDSVAKGQMHYPLCCSA